jgi:hypothetical protein
MKRSYVQVMSERLDIGFLCFGVHRSHYELPYVALDFNKAWVLGQGVVDP